LFVLFFTMPFLSSVASVNAMAAHTHICHDEKHDDDCGGTAECCRICQSIYRIKNQPSYCLTSSKLLSTPVPAWFALCVNFGCQHITYIDPVSLKVRLNN
jgi:hypothetical protein